MSDSQGDKLTITATEATIMLEIANRKLHQKDIAQTYAMLIRAWRSSRDINVNWGRISAAIRERWGEAGLVRVKTMAWKEVEQAMSDSQGERVRVEAEPCSCVFCGMCSGSGSYWVDMSGHYDSSPDCCSDLETCDECGGSGIVESCDRCQLLKEMDWEDERLSHDQQA